ncbi:hypothetical protein K2173_010787 [Erythroxylum novogranatense]|uniref:Chitin-inducible gibberellin-responsive protein 1 n=1 Tax=Erythroxylum novogranatense TaxID=1862640 RepID=A0AAV8SRQ3_9ROSI|nr:hypothetical protein K2173_010787 [Erythroxylum novogranatense]
MPNLELQGVLRDGATGAGLSYSVPYPSIPLLPSRLYGSLKFEIGNSPSSPFSTQFDGDTANTLSDSQEKHSSADVITGAGPSCNSSIQSIGYFHRLSPSSSQDASSSQNMKHALLQLETALMGTDDDEDVTMPNNSIDKSSRPQSSGQRTKTWCQEHHQSSQGIQPKPSFVSRNRLLGEGAPDEKRQKAVRTTSLQNKPPGNLKQLLIACAKALAENNVNDFNRLTEMARGKVSISGEAIQRLGAYLIEGLIARKESSGTNIYRALRCREPESKDLLSYMQILYEICPYLKFGYMAANGAIAEACRNEDRIHIVDFQIAQGTQWMTLLQALAARPGGSPHVRITGIDDPVNKYARGDGLGTVGRRLTAISEKFNISIEFNGLPVFAPDVTREMLDIRPGEALVVNFPLQLHHTPDESVDVNNPRDGLLRMVKSLNPKVTTLVEQESNTNTTPFLTRFVETLEFYLAMFESIDEIMPRDQKERIGVEQQCIARDMVNIIACEGKERVERHELLGKWKSRFTMAGFRPYPLSSYVSSVIRSLLRCYSEHYTLLEKDGAMLLGWKERNLVSASAWH